MKNPPLGAWFVNISLGLLVAVAISVISPQIYNLVLRELVGRHFPRYVILGAMCLFGDFIPAIVVASLASIALRAGRFASRWYIGLVVSSFAIAIVDMPESSATIVPFTIGLLGQLIGWCLPKFMNRSQVSTVHM